MDYDVIIVGGGPAGSSAAIRLASSGLNTLLLEEKSMPRDKLCGEFITPESFPSLRRLGVLDSMMSAGAQRITSVNLVAPNGESFKKRISDLSEVSSVAMSLSRARFDQILFEKARESGATCLEGIAVRNVILEDNRPRGVEALSLKEGKTLSFHAGLVVDASGRNSRLTLTPDERIGGRPGSRLYGLKAHLRSVDEIEDQVELYFFPGGYGGLSRVEDGKVNLCFIASEEAFKASRGDPEKIAERTIMRNRLASERLRRSEIAGPWLSTGPLTFGVRRLARNGIITAGDSSGMIDPFTGTGIQMALRAGELAAGAIISAIGSAPDPVGQAAALYRARHEEEFGRRMIVAGLLRRVAFSPAISNALSIFLARTPWLARMLLRATRA
ncbi:MAG TPA: FAD-dependent monooxygenase [Blastocatellia bacterium]|nr:FAD-dependent monooxygenase [Blastocatellia bacterium]